VPELDSFGKSMPSLFLMVLGKDLEPDRVSVALGLRPSDSWRRGEKKCAVLPNGKTLHFKSVHKWGGWKFHYQRARTDAALVRKMRAVLTRLSKRKSKLRALTRSGHEVFLISLVQDAASIVVPPKLHALLGELGIHLQIDFWPSAKT
jgi:hypothetical protein